MKSALKSLPARLCMEGPLRPTLVLNPVSDRTFGAFAEQELDSARDPKEFEDRLRTRYLAAAVNARVLSGESTTIWYVYRDGHWTSARRDGG
jgi:hypothetical protein